MKAFTSIQIALFACLLAGNAALGADPARHALVIANSAYKGLHPLCNPPNDGKEVASALEKQGFLVDQVSEANLKVMNDAIAAFVLKLRPGDIAFFFFSGHGAQIQNQNYLIPVDFTGKDERSLVQLTVSATNIQNQMENTGARMRLIVLDACSTNPFQHTGQKGGRYEDGLAAMSAGTGTLIAFAASPGKPAYEHCNQHNSVFTASLLESMTRPARGSGFSAVFEHAKQLTADKTRGTDSEQFPYISSSMIDDKVPFVPGAITYGDELAYWEAVVRINTIDTYKSFLEKFPDGVFAPEAKNQINLREHGSTTLPAPAAVVLRLKGSNTIGSELAPALAQRFLETVLQATNVRIIRTGENSVVVGEANGRQEKIEIEALNSDSGFTALANDSADIAMASERVEPRHVTGPGGIHNEGNMRSSRNEHVIGVDGVTIIVSQSNRIPFLTVDQLRDIFSGKTEYWEDVRGYVSEGSRSRHRIEVYARAEGSGTWTFFRNKILGDRPLAPRASRIKDSKELSDTVASHPDAIGFIGMPFVLNSRPVMISALGGDPKAANRLNVRTFEYYLSRELYLYTRSAPSNENVQRFIEFVRAHPEIVEGSGFVGLGIDGKGNCDKYAGPRDEFARVIGDACRLPINFRFPFDRAEFQNLGLADIDRLRTEAIRAAEAGDEIILAGFTDSVGSDRYNLELSSLRARFVEGGLGEMRNVRALGFGKLHPLADNRTEEGRAANRRVEVWRRHLK